MEKLKTCPFCGNLPDMTRQPNKKQVTIKCPGCAVEYKQKFLRLTIEQLETLMISRWNTRKEAA